MSSWDYDDYDYYAYYGYDDTSEAYDGPFPLDFLPFRNLCEASMGYLDTQEEYPLYDATMIEFIAIADSAVAGTAYVYELKFHKVIVLPPELCLKVYTHYLDIARSDSTLAKHLHVDRFNNPCCTWRWPEDLIICDRHSGDELLTAEYAPWLPNLAFPNKQLLGEVSVCMLSTTKWFDFKYEEYKTFKIVRWFTDFLSTFPTVMVDGVATTEGFKAIKRIGFPHASKYNEHRIGRVVNEKNPDITLMLKCTKLDAIAMVFNWRQLVNNTHARDPRDLYDFLDFFHFEPMLEHKNVNNIYLEGVYPREGEGQTLACLFAFGKWLVKEFRRRGREVNVHMQKRCGSFVGRIVGLKLVVDE
jgi:hypothetical protein